MKIIRLSFAILSLACIAHGATNDTFEITSYFPDKGTVGITSGEGRTNRPFSSFSAEEQKQITGWLADKEYQNGGLRVEITEKKKTSRAVPGNLIGQIEEVSYSISLENRSSSSFSEVQIESCIFYKTKDGNVEANRCARKSDKLSLSVEKTQTVETAGVQIRDARTRSTQPSSGSTIDLPFGGSFTTGDRPTTTSADWKYTPPTHYKDRLLGMYLCVSKKDRNGKIIKQEFEEGRVPDKNEWATYR